MTPTPVNCVGGVNGLDAVVLDEVWQKMHEFTNCNILCLWCMDRIASDLGMDCQVELHFSGLALYGSNVNWSMCKCQTGDSNGKVE